MPNGDERLRLIRRMVDIVAEECPWILGTHPFAYTLQQAWLKNYKPHEVGHGLARYYRIDTDLRNKLLAGVSANKQDRAEQTDVYVRRPQGELPHGLLNQLPHRPQRGLSQNTRRRNSRATVLITWRLWMYTSRAIRRFGCVSSLISIQGRRM